MIRRVCGKMSLHFAGREIKVGCGINTSTDLLFVDAFGLLEYMKVTTINKMSGKFLTKGVYEDDLDEKKISKYH